MFFELLNLLRNFFFTGSYSNQVFPEPLTDEEEENLLQKKGMGDKEARNKLIEHNLRLVAHIVKKFDPRDGEQDDLISIGTIGLINNKFSKNISLNDAIGYDKDGNEIAILDILKTPKQDMIDDLTTKDNIKLLREYINILTEQERQILIMRYGLNNQDALTQKEIAKQMKISRSYVSRIEKRALTKILREFIRNNNIE